MVETNLPISLNGTQVIHFELHVPNQGPWFAYCDLAEQVSLSGKVEILVGSVALAGTINPTYSGSFALQSRYMVVGGANGWGKIIRTKDYHNDAKVLVSTVLSETATEVGELIGDTIDLPSSTFAIDYIRKAGYASKVLEDCAAGAPWWIDFDGNTNVGKRPTSVPSADSFILLHYNPITKEATCGLNDFPGLPIGSTITDSRLDAPITIRELVVTSDGEKLLAKAWCDDSTGTKSRIAQTLQSIVTRCTDGKIWGKWRYRVLAQSTDGRLDLQVVNKSAGLPDSVLVPVVSIAGVHVDFTPGAIVLVEFCEGDPALPRVTGASEWDQSGCFVPKRITLGANADTATNGQDAARKGDSIEGLLPPATFVGTINGQPATGVVIWAYPKVLGTVTTGSTKVGIVT